MRQEIVKLLSEFITEAKSRSDKLEEFTTFKGKDGQVPGVRAAKSLTGRRLEIALSKTKEWHEETKKSWGEK